MLLREPDEEARGAGKASDLRRAACIEKAVQDSVAVAAANIDADRYAALTRERPEGEAAPAAVLHRSFEADDRFGVGDEAEIAGTGVRSGADYERRLGR